MGVGAAVNFVLTYYQVLLRKPLFYQDEAAHALQGLIIARDLRTHDLPALLLDSYRQVYWPPVFSWLSGLFFLLFGVTAETARASSLVCLIPLPVVLFLAGRHLFPRRPWLAGWLAAALTLTSAPLANLASESMLEAPGILALSVGLWLSLRLMDRATVTGAVALGVAMTLTYLTRSSYGIVLVLAVMLERLWSARLNPREAFWKAPERYGFVTLGVGLLIWFAYPAKLLRTWAALVQGEFTRSGEPVPYSLHGLLFYPRALASLIAPWWLLALLLVAVAASLRRLTDPRLRILLIFMAVQMGFATLSKNKAERYIVTMLPPVFLIGGFWLAALVHQLWDRRTGVAKALAVLVPLLVVAGLSQACYTELFARPPAPEGQQAFVELVRHLSELSRRTGPLLVASSADARPPVIDWYLAAEGGMPVFSAGSLASHDEAQWRAARSVSPALAEAIAGLRDRSRRPRVTRSLYAGYPLEAPELLTEESYATAVLETALGDEFPAVAIVKTPAAAALYQKGLLESGLVASGYHLADSTDSPVPAATIKLYAR